MIETFKILRGGTGMDFDDIFRQATEDRTPSNNANLWHVRSRQNVHANGFRNEVIGTWNQLSSELVSTEGVDNFKTTLDEMRYELFPVLQTKEAGCRKALRVLRTRLPPQTKLELQNKTGSGGC